MKDALLQKFRGTDRHRQDVCVGEREQGETEQPLKGFMCVCVSAKACMAFSVSFRPCLWRLWRSAKGKVFTLAGLSRLCHARGSEGWRLGQTQASSGKRSYKKITHRGLAHPPKALQSAGGPWEQKQEGDCAKMGG